MIQGKIEELSDYDPLDLSSGVPERMARALDALFSNPQNNLRLFVNGAAMQLPPAEKLRSGWEPLQPFGGLQGLIKLLCDILIREGETRQSELPASICHGSADPSILIMP